MVFVPPLAAFIQSAGHEIEASSVPVFAAAQFAGGAPVKNFKTADAPIVVSIESSIALRTAVEN
jgi:hypothetical protein